MTANLGTLVVDERFVLPVIEIRFKGPTIFVRASQRQRAAFKIPHAEYQYVLYDEDGAEVARQRDRMGGRGQAGDTLSFTCTIDLNFTDSRWASSR